MKRFGSIILGLVFLAIAGILAALCVKEELPYIRAKREADAIAEKFILDGDGLRSEIDITPLGMKIDFEGLKGINPDIIGWIYIPGTQVNYPILQHPSDDSYYLHHTPEGNENILGSVYTYASFSKDFTDPHMILFGHNMSSGQMFGELSNYTDRGFYGEYPYVYIYLPGKSMKCIIYSAYACSVGDATFTKGYGFNTAEFADFIRHTKDMSCWDSGITPTSVDSIITLSTCTDAGYASERFIVNCMVSKVKSADGSTHADDGNLQTEGVRVFELN